MSIHDADEIRCRSCFRVTPWAAFCTHCGAALPARQAYRPFEPEPEDELVRGPQGAREGPGPAAIPPDAPEEKPHPPSASPPPPAVPEPADDLEQIDRFRAAAFSDRYQPEESPRRGIGPLAIVAIVALGVMALGMGVILSGVVSGLAQATSSPTPTVQPTASAAPSPTILPSPSPTLAPTPTAASSAGPVVFPDGFTAVAEPCAEQPTNRDGCGSSGATISTTSIWIWVGFTHGLSADIVTAALIDATGTRLRDNTISFVDIGCTDPCNGWLRYRFSSLKPGSYTVWIERNGQLAATTAFTVTS